MQNPFTQHPHRVGQTYLGHLFTACGYSIKLIFLGLACIIHSILPFLFINTASENVMKLAEHFKQRRDNDGKLPSKTLE